MLDITLLRKDLASVVARLETRQSPQRSLDVARFGALESERKATPDSVRAYMRENYFAGQWKPDYEPLVEIQAGWLLGPDRERMAWTSALTTDMVFTQPVVHEFPDLKVAPA